jgi:hypothetical protein
MYCREEYHETRYGTDPQHTHGELRTPPPDLAQLFLAEKSGQAYDQEAFAT